jgi:hypothetical protein
MNRLWIPAALLGLALGGCQLSQRADAEPAEYNLNEAITLAGGQQAAIRGENLSLRFTDVPEDSRCPTQVECFWTGQARVSVVVAHNGGTPTTVQFNTNPAPGQNMQTVDVDQYGIELKSLDPYPQTPHDSPALEDYRATLLVRKTA